MTVEEVQKLLKTLGFPSDLNNKRTARTILALADRKPRQDLPHGRRSLAEGARVHDILQYIREELHGKVAENTRETYRKMSLRPLCDAGLVIRHQLATNDPNTFYRLAPRFDELLSSSPGKRREQLMEELRLTGRRVAAHRKAEDGVIEVAIPGAKSFRLSPGPHNDLERLAVEELGPILCSSPQVVYLGDAASRSGFQNRRLMRAVNLPLDLTASLPDVILHDSDRKEIVLIEAVTSTGAITESRLNQLQELATGARKAGMAIRYITVFPSRRTFRRFVEQIAWGSSVWIADEPSSMIHFVELNAEI